MYHQQQVSVGRKSRRAHHTCVAVYDFADRPDVVGRRSGGGAKRPPARRADASSTESTDDADDAFEAGSSWQRVVTRPETFWNNVGEIPLAESEVDSDSQRCAAPGPCVDGGSDGDDGSDSVGSALRCPCLNGRTTACKMQPLATHSIC